MSFGGSGTFAHTTIPEDIRPSFSRPYLTIYKEMFSKTPWRTMGYSSLLSLKEGGT